MAQHDPPSALVLVTAAHERFCTPFRERLAERFNRYAGEWLAQYSPQQYTQHELADAYARHGVNFEQEVYGILGDIHWEFVHVLAYKRAIVETGREFRAALKRYRVHVRALTADASPFPAEWKAFGQDHWRLFEAMDYEALQVKWMREDVGDDTAFVRGNPLTDDWHGHPAWKNFEVWLFELLTRQHGLSERVAFELISLTLKHFLGDVHFPAKEGPATIRLRIKRQQRQKGPFLGKKGG